MPRELVLNQGNAYRLTGVFENSEADLSQAYAEVEIGRAHV
jgi:hypothetical protein